MHKRSEINEYLPMSETAYYILLALTKPNHGYGIMIYVEQLTNKRISLGPGTLYGSLSKMQKNNLIILIEEQSNRKIYQTTEFGKKVLKKEIERLKELYLNSREVLNEI